MSSMYWRQLKTWNILILQQFGNAIHEFMAYVSNFVSMYLFLWLGQVYWI